MERDMTSLGGGVGIAETAAPGRPRVHVGRTWLKEEEARVFADFFTLCVAQGMSSATAAVWIEASFPTDRKLSSIRLKLDNHLWLHSNGAEGLFEANRWGWSAWADRKTPEEMDFLRKLHAEKRAEKRERRKARQA